MKKIEKSLVEKYIIGEDLYPYSIDELENDIDFMINVVNYTNDVKMYNLCSDELKENYKFVNYLVKKFKEDSDSIVRIANHFLKKSTFEIEKMELAIIMEKILSNDLSNQYKFYNRSLYFKNRLEIKSIGDDTLGMGFFLIFDEYNSSDIILEYYAKCMIDELFVEYDIDLEKLLHNKFKKPDQIDKKGIKIFIINLFENYDSMLSAYLCTHLYLIEDIVKEVKQIQKNWDKYNEEDEFQRYNDMLDMVHDYMYESGCIVSEYEMLYYVAKKLGIKDKVAYYDIPNEFSYNLNPSFDENIMYEMVEFEIKNSLKARKVYKDVRKIMINQIFSNKPLDLYTLIEPKHGLKENNCKIIELNFKNKNKG